MTDLPWGNFAGQQIQELPQYCLNKIKAKILLHSSEKKNILAIITYAISNLSSPVYFVLVLVLLRWRMKPDKKSCYIILMDLYLYTASPYIVCCR